MKNIFKVISTLLITGSAATGFGVAAFSSSPLSTVNGAEVNKGEKSVELRMGYTDDESGSANENRFQMREHIDYAFTDSYALRLVVAQDKRNDEDMEHRGVSIENRLQFFDKETDGWNGGMRLIYTETDGDKKPNSAGLNLISEIPLDSNIEWTTNYNFDHETGSNMRYGTAFELRNQVTTKVESPVTTISDLEIGAEMFNDFGILRDVDGYDSQDHQIGPVIKGKFVNNYYFETGYRGAISDNAPDNLFKFNIGRKF